MNILNNRDGMAILQQAGYRFYQNDGEHKEYYVTSAQKRFDDDKGKKYFISIDIYHFSGTKFPFPWMYEASVQFTTNQQDDEVFNASYNATGKTIEQMEAFFERLWTQMECSHYEEYK